MVIGDSPIGVRADLNGGFDVVGFSAHDYDNELEGLATKTFKEMSFLWWVLKIQFSQKIKLS